MSTQLTTFWRRDIVRPAASDSFWQLTPDLEVRD